MILDALTFGLCLIYLGVVSIMFAVGLIDIADPPVSARCDGCARWIFDPNRTLRPFCQRCRKATHR
ncbi:hypothetical protein OHB26_29345 [Nocardia sp. NBC_01503]|uniref:hypothetical protein n=1 Tax=Nocardia sp. NBC_01503 TaxID=2975997 RepID=UPI002E7C33D0|nr:hypothetical protein [Nocardia sp. NBC_01503]WTL30996.1 hypothetical protein OHB26_29345 [Nocardia sp. NBC_01503]